uniref:Uncharacterized protein n=1 Tax=Avena sativa TaxID=4498 RepID=A0ACD5YMY4_AVESA
MEAGGARKRKRISAGINSGEVAPTEAPVPGGGAGEHGRGGADRISDLPDDNLRHIISLLPTKEAARTRILASRWRHLWCSAPLNFDCRVLAAADEDGYNGMVETILSSHQGPVRRFCVDANRLADPPGATDAWFRSAAFDNLEELEFHSIQQPPPASIFRFSPTLRAVTIGRTVLADAALHGLQFPLLKHLGLALVVVSEPSLHGLIAGCPALECLLIDRCVGVNCIRINSLSLVSLGARVSGLPASPSDPLLHGELVIENAPCLQRLLLLNAGTCLHVTVVALAAPKLETLGFLNGENYLCGFSRILFGSTLIQLAKSGPSNSWRRKHRNLIKSLDIRLKTIVLGSYLGNKTQVNLVKFFVLNSRVLESMTLEFYVGTKLDNEEFLLKQRLDLQLEKKASRGAKVHLTTDCCLRSPWDVKHVRDLDLADPFTCQ